MISSLNALARVFAHPCSIGLFLFLFPGLATVNAQNSEPPKSYIEKMIPSSPTVASLGKFGDIPVNYANGLPTIEIPLFEIKGRELTLPVTMSYHAGGVKVEETPGWVGMNWSLSAGGMITRSVMGTYDESGNGYLENRFLQNEQYLFNDGNACEYLESIADGDDTQPDIFIYNFGPYSGKFYHSSASSGFTFIPYQKFKIDILSDDQHGYTSMKITTPDGIQYFFGGTYFELTRYHSGGNGSNYNQVYNSTWFLNRIVTPNLTDTILFLYTADTSYSNAKSESKDCFLYTVAMPPGGQSTCNQNQGFCEPTDTNYSTTTTSGWALDEIVSSTSILKFHKSQRTDTKESMGKRLDSITIYSNTYLGAGTVPFKRFGFFYSYQSKFPNSSNYLDKRLFLDSIIEYGFSVNELNQLIRRKKPPYSFTYFNADQLPPRNSKAQDHWGFYNGAPNETLIPAMVYNTYQWDGGNRETDITKTTYGVLNKISYPTGGTTMFEFEANKAQLYPPEPIIQTLEGHVGTYGKECESYDCDEHEEECCNQNITYIDVDSLDNTAFLTVELPDAEQLEIAHSCYPYVWIMEADVPQSKQIFIPQNGITQQIIPFPVTNTKYQIGAFACKDEAYTAYIQLTYQKLSGWKYDQNVGGARLVKITDNTGNKPVIKKFEYDDVFHPGRSSGVLNMRICYTYEYNRVTYNYQLGGSTPPVYYIYSQLSCKYLRRSASPLWPLGASGGSHIGYSWIKEIHGEYGENGNVIYHYSQNANSTPPGNYTIPPTDESWRRGQMLSSETFDSQNQLNKKVTNHYTDIPMPFNKSTGFIVNKKEPATICEFYNWGEEGTIHESTYYSYEAGLRYLDSTAAVSYFPDATPDEITASHTYVYDTNQLMLRADTTYQSDGSKLITRYSYPPDYTFASCESTLATIENTLANSLASCRSWFNTALPTCSTPIDTIGIFNSCLQTAYDQYNASFAGYIDCIEEQANSSSDEVKSLIVLQSQNNINPVIEEQKLKLTNGAGNKVLFDGTYTEYKSGSANPTKNATTASSNQAYQFIIHKVFSANPIPFANFTTSVISNNAIVKDNSYKPVHFFDEYTYWGKLAQYHKINDLITAFSWSYKNSSPVIIGENITYDSLQTAITESTTNVHDFFLSLGDMTTDAQKNSLKSFIATLFTNSKVGHAKLKVYTHKPLIGITSVTDPAGIATYYEYDAFGRLCLIRDNNNNVMKKYKYHYQQSDD